MTATILPFTPESNESAGAMERYRQAYCDARAITDFAEKVRLGGIVLGGILVVAASLAGQLGWHSGLRALSLLLLAFAVVAVLAGHIWGKVFQAQGRLLEMGVDAALNSSPFLSNMQRVAAMCLRQEAENLTSIETRTA